MKKLLCTMFVLAVGAFAVFGFFGCASNPYTNQLAEIDSDEVREAASAYKSVIAWYTQNNRLWTNTELGQQVVKVGNNLIAAAKEWERVNNKGKFIAFYHKNSWEINFVGESEWNAWCMAGGKICVYSGLFQGPAAIQTEDELAAVLGHEIAHALLFHTKRGIDYNESVSKIGLGNDKKTAFSRALETEADKVGLTLMILAGYDGNAATDLWGKMANARGHYDEFTASHPADWRRVNTLRKEIVHSQKIAQKISQGKKAVQFIAPTLSVSACADAGISYHGIVPKVSLEKTISMAGLGASFFLPNGMETWLGSAYGKLNFRFGTSSENIFSPLYGIEFTKGYFGGVIGADVDIKLINRLYLRGQAGFRWSWKDDGDAGEITGFPMLVFGLGMVWAIK